MDDWIANMPEPQTEAEYEAACDALVAEMKRMNERSKSTWEEIEHLKAESAASRAEGDAIAAQIDRRLASIYSLLDEMQQDRKLDRLRHENFMLRLDNILLRFERRLPPSAPSNESGSEPS